MPGISNLTGGMTDVKTDSENHVPGTGPRYRSGNNDRFIHARGLCGSSTAAGRN